MNITTRFLLLSIIAWFGYSQLSLAADYWPNAKVEAFIDELVADEGFDREQLIASFSRVEREPRALPLMRKAPETKAARQVNSWKKYQQRFITDFHINGGRAFALENAYWLHLAEQIYGVPAHVIVAIIGIETNYGSYTGDFVAMNVLTTLAFEHPRRHSFFRRELKNLLLLAREGKDDVFDFTSSYAGAMGMPQFIPSSFRAYAVDLNADGRRDIWQTTADVIGSVANFLKQARWQPDQPIASQVQALVNTAELSDYMRSSIKPQWQLRQLQQLVQAPAGWSPDLDVALFTMPAEPERELWLGSANLHSISRYNPSRSYALVVHMLAERLAQPR